MKHSRQPRLSKRLKSIRVASAAEESVQRSLTGRRLRRRSDSSSRELPPLVEFAGHDGEAIAFLHPPLLGILHHRRSFSKRSGNGQSRHLEDSGAGRVNPNVLDQQIGVGHRQFSATILPFLRSNLWSDSISRFFNSDISVSVI